MIKLFLFIYVIYVLCNNLDILDRLKDIKNACCLIKLVSFFLRFNL